MEIPLATHEDIDEVGRYLFEHGQYVTMAAYPLVPKDEVGFRIQVTAANTDEQIEDLVTVLGNLHERFQLEPTSPRRSAGSKRGLTEQPLQPGGRHPTDPSAVDPQVRGGHVARIVAGQEEVGAGHLVRRPHPAQAGREPARFEPPDRRRAASR